MDSFLRRIIRGGGDRPTRFHDERGNAVSPGGYLYMPISLVTTLFNRAFGYYPATPWLSYRAQRHIAHLLRPDWTVLEFGSGMSTAWFARRCRTVYSFEHNPAWHARITSYLAERNLSNVCYFLRDQSRYSDLSLFPEAFFDFVLVDGICRADCVRNAVGKLKPGGWIYLDNTDMRAGSNPRSDYQQAERALLGFVRQDGGRARYFTDFVPNNFFAKQGMLVNLRLSSLSDPSAI